MTETTPNPMECGYKCGALPPCSPLALSIVPPQGNATPKYDPSKALARGTLFPGLDLPLGNMVNQDTADVPMAELMALCFAAHDLSLYLDTHPNDADAFAAYKDLLLLVREGKQRYAQRYGPISKQDMEDSNSYDWLTGPWPWDYDGRREA